MPISTYVENIESVDENLRSFYKQTESGNGYILDAEPVNGYAVENVENLRSALGKERTERKEFEKKYTILSKKFEGVDPEEFVSIKTQYESLQQKYEELAKLDPESEAAKLAEEKIRLAEEKINGKLTSKQKEWQKLHEQEVGSRDERIKGLTGQLKSLMVDNTATNALVEAGIVPEHMELILPKVTGSMRLVDSEDGKLVAEIIDAEGNPRVRSDGQNMSLKDLIPELQAKWPSSFSAEVKRGGGMKASKPTTTTTTTEKSANEKILAGLTALK